MPVYYDSEGKSHKLAKEIGRGGEGAVYFCEGNDELVAKIYHEAISDEKAKKLQLMATNKNERLLKVAAWVVETLHDKPNGKVIGFLMARIKAKEIHELYSLKSRRRHFPQATWHYLIHSSTNLARAFYGLHKYKHVIGDVNHGNCVVLADGTVKLIDCDSYAISDGEKRFRCDVGVATHLAPELQKANLSEVERKPEHDNFSLAVVIFQLLFLGRHPFAGNYLGEKDKTLEDCIREFRFAYGKNSEKLKVKQPPGTLFLDEVSPEITGLFERAFDEKSDNRPTPREWIEALVDLSQNLTQCGVNPGHRFYSDLASCPWCRIESQTGLMLFPFVFSEEQADDETPFNIFTVEKLINNLGNRRHLPAKLVKPNSLPAPKPAKEIIELTTHNRNHLFVFVGGYFCAIVFLTLIFGVLLGTIFGICLMIYLFATLSNDNKELQSNLMGSLNQSEKKLIKLENEYAQKASPEMFKNDITVVRNKVNDYKALQLNSHKNLRQIELDYKHRNEQHYLRKFSLANCEIKGVSKNTRENLSKQKVWTAAEIDKDQLINNHKVDPSVTKHLLNWRSELEKDFVFEDKNNNVKKQKEKYLESLKLETKQIEKDIEKSLEQLRKDIIATDKSQKLLIPKSEKLAKEVLQNRINLNAVGDTSFAFASLILITVLVPLFGGIISEMNSSKNRTYVENTQNSQRYDDGYGTITDVTAMPNYEKNLEGFRYSKEVLTPQQAKDLSIPDKAITNEAILELDDTFRKELSDNLVRQAIHRVKHSEGISLKEQKKRIGQSRDKLWLAIRVKKDNSEAFEKYGIILYNYQFHQESLKYLLELEARTERTDTTQSYIGINYLALNKNRKAQKIFEKLTKNDTSGNSYFNLGLAYNGLKQYKKAVEAFENAIERMQFDTDTHYELGLAYFKLNQKEKFNRQYAILLDINEVRAEELLDKSYKLPPSKKEIDAAEDYKFKEGFKDSKNTNFQ